MKKFLFAIVMCVMLVGLTACGPTTFTVSDPWSRPALARGTGAAYFIIENPGQADALLSAASDIAETVEIHKTVMEQSGTMQMMKMDRIAVSANSKTEFKPGGSHVMFINLKRDLKEGETFALKLVFEKAGEINLQVKVQNR
jgi:periplasmic copper chaperone A